MPHSGNIARLRSVIAFGNNAIQGVTAVFLRKCLVAPVKSAHALGVVKPRAWPCGGKNAVIVPCVEIWIAAAHIDGDIVSLSVGDYIAVNLQLLNHAAGKDTHLESGCFRKGELC